MLVEELERRVLDAPEGTGGQAPEHAGEPAVPVTEGRPVLVGHHLPHGPLPPAGEEVLLQPLLGGAIHRRGRPDGVLELVDLEVEVVIERGMAAPIGGHGPPHAAAQVGRLRVVEPTIGIHIPHHGVTRVDLQDEPRVLLLLIVLHLGPQARRVTEVGEVTLTDLHRPELRPGLGEDRDLGRDGHVGEADGGEVQADHLRAQPRQVGAQGVVDGDVGGHVAVGPCVDPPHPIFLDLLAQLLDLAAQLGQMSAHAADLDHETLLVVPVHGSSLPAALVCVGMILAVC